MVDRTTRQLRVARNVYLMLTYMDRFLIVEVDEFFNKMIYLFFDLTYKN